MSGFFILIVDGRLFGGSCLLGGWENKHVSCVLFSFFKQTHSRFGC